MEMIARGFRRGIVALWLCSSGAQSSDDWWASLIPFASFVAGRLRGEAVGWG